MVTTHPKNGSPPRVSIGLPVFNGENYIGEALQSLLEQSYMNFEVIISDNASSDRTEEICLSYAERDPRINYFRNVKNIGAAGNFNLLFERAKGDYFKWAAHDDLIAPTFMEKCVEVLEKDNSVALCFTKIRPIDAEGRFLEEQDSGLQRVGSRSPQERFANLVLVDHPCTFIFGLIRSSLLRLTPLIANYIASDRVLLAELGLLGRFHEINESLFFSREHPQRSTRAIPFHLRKEWFGPNNRGRRIFPHWRFYGEYFRCLKRIPHLTPHERRRCYRHLIRWPGVNQNWGRLLADLMIAIYPDALKVLLKARNRYNHSNLPDNAF
jgi:glycosyltransferase involved in cell wall biosynthesis